MHCNHIQTPICTICAKPTAECNSRPNVTLTQMPDCAFRCTKPTECISLWSIITVMRCTMVGNQEAAIGNQSCNAEHIKSPGLMTSEHHCSSIPCPDQYDSGLRLHASSCAIPASGVRLLQLACWLPFALAFGLHLCIENTAHVLTAMQN